MGICNGFQILVETGLVPGVLLRNKYLEFICKNVFVKINDKKNKYFKPDFEGLTIRDEADGKGYLIASVQGSNGYLLIDRKSLNAKIFFRIIDGDKIDGTTETDGIDVTLIKTSKFPNGFFLLHRMMIMTA